MPAKVIKEPGIEHFDVLQDPEDPKRFLLVEVYRNQDAPAKHKRYRALSTLANPS